VAAEVAAIGVAVAAAARTAAVVEARTEVVAAETHTGIANLLAKTMARPDLPGGLFVCVSTSTEVFESQFTSLPPHLLSQLFRPARVT
jgi:hypothetical protein